MQLDTQIIINSKSEEVRDIFLDFQKHSEWNPFFSSFKIYTSGETSPLPGTQLEIKMKLNGGNENTMYPNVLENSASLDGRANCSLISCLLAYILLNLFQ